MCEHKYIHLDTALREERSVYQTKYIRIDTYFCEKCLEYKDTERSEWARREIPTWFHK